MIIDTHIHLDDMRYADDLDEVLFRAKKEGVCRYIIPGADPKTLDRAVMLSEQYKEIYFAVGVHPYDTQSFDALEFSKYVHHPKCLAIGECGLDYYRLEGSDENKRVEKSKQARVFRAQIELAKYYKKPLIVHIRDASSDAKDILIESDAQEVGGVLHCYNADEQLLCLADKNFYFGIGGVLTFKNAKKLVDVLPKIPKERLIIETDGPYLTPHPHRGKRNEPAYCALVVEKMSELLNSSKNTLENITTKNAEALFNLEAYVLDENTF